MEPKYPAAADRYVNLGEFYDIAAAKTARDDVIRHTKAVSAAYQRAYRALGAARQVEDNAAALMAGGLDANKLLHRTDGIIGREIHGKGPGGPDALRFLGSLTCTGPIWRFDTAAALCPKVYQLQDTFGFAAPMLEQIRTAARARGYRAIVCPDPEHIDRIQHLLLPDLELAFVTSREGMVYDGPAYRRVRLDAMIPGSYYKQYKSRMKFMRRVTEVLRQDGLEALREAKTAHDALEAVYTPYVDFEGVNACTARELERIESYL